MCVVAAEAKQIHFQAADKNSAEPSSTFLKKAAAMHSRSDENPRASPDTQSHTDFKFGFHTAGMEAEKDVSDGADAMNGAHPASPLTGQKLSVQTKPFTMAPSDNSFRFSFSTSTDS